MISIHVTLYTTDEGDRFKVMKANDADILVDVTSDYEVASVRTEDGRTGFTVIPKLDVGHDDAPSARHPSILSV